MTIWQFYAFYEFVNMILCVLQLIKINAFVMMLDVIVTSRNI